MCQQALKAVEACPEQANKVQGRMMAGQSLFLARLGQYDEAKDLAQAGLKISEQAQNLVGQASALMTLGLVDYDGNTYPSARHNLEAAQALYARLGEKRFEAQCILLLGLIACDEAWHNEAGERIYPDYQPQKFAEAKAYFEKARRLNRSCQDNLLEALLVHNLG